MTRNQANDFLYNTKCTISEMPFILDKFDFNIFLTHGKNKENSTIVKPRLGEKFYVTTFYVTNTFDRVDSTANIRGQFNA